MGKAKTATIALLTVSATTMGVGPASSSDEGSFVATSPPGSCQISSYATGTRKFTASESGVLIVEAGPFGGDWDLELWAPGSGLLASAQRNQTNGSAPWERLRFRLEKDQEVDIVACNRLSAQTALKVRYRLETGDGYPPPGQVAPGFTFLAPGGPADLHETVPVQFVFLAYDQAQIDLDAFRAALPAASRPLSRIATSRYGIKAFLGIDYAYDYSLVFPPEAYEDAFFAALLSLGTEAPLTAYQEYYNGQVSRGLDITDNFEIPAVEVERWLSANPPPGVDTTRNTVFLINWFGRQDFRFHVYTKTGEPDADTGQDFGLEDASKLIAWGGTTADDPESGLGSTRRIWLHDLSAGPDAWTANWLVDVSSDGLPPVWEYRPDGPRDHSALTGDLARLARYVAIDLLLTPSPLYPPEITPPALPTTIDIDINTYEGWNGVDASEQFIEPALVRDVASQILPLNIVTLDEQDLPVNEPQFLVCWAQWNSSYSSPGCYPQRPYQKSENLFVHHAVSSAWRDDSGTVDYEAGVFHYADSAYASRGGGFAGDNSRDGTQSFAHVFISPNFMVTGMSGVIIHELGHHFSLSHPHDGYDYEEDLHFGPGQMQIVWTGDEVNSVMSYLNINDDFSQFDRDNRNRWMTAASLAQAQAIAETVLDSSPPESALSALHEADVRIGAAREAFAAHEYLTAYEHAWNAYRRVVGAAELAGLVVLGNNAGTTADAARVILPPDEFAYAYDDPIASAPGVGKFAHDLLAR